MHNFREQTIARPVKLHIIIVSITTAVAITDASLFGLFSEEVQSNIGALPIPASLENMPREKPMLIHCIMVVPIVPPTIWRKPNAFCTMQSKEEIIFCLNRINTYIHNPV